MTKNPYDKKKASNGSTLAETAGQTEFLKDVTAQLEETSNRIFRPTIMLMFANWRRIARNNSNLQMNDVVRVTLTRGHRSLRNELSLDSWVSLHPN